MKNGNVYREALLVTALNPKGVIFFIAFFPLFINYQKAAMPQMIIIGISFLLVSTASGLFYSTFAAYLRSKIKTEKFQNTFNKVSGTMLMGAGAVTASIQK